jgi:Fe(3+) dicitrate transport protein
MTIQSRFNLVASAIFLALSAPIMANEKTEETITIIGNKEAAQKTAGSAHVITEADLEEFEYSDINSILRQIPGVYVRQEDGYGLRPNIGIRSAASGAERSNKITLMEDGILVAPAPYAASAAYYSPTAGRISGLEVLKGPAAITEGPYTVGGAVNYLSTPIPYERGGQIMIESGSNGALREHVNYGDSQENIGWLLEAYNQKDNGFKSIDFSDKTTGLDKTDYIAKLRINSSANAKNYQELLVKYLKADETSNQSYLGLTDADFALTPYRRYAASQNDQMNVEHEQFQLQYSYDLNEEISLHAVAYRNETARNWYKASKVGGMKLGAIIDAANDGDATAISLLHGEAEGDVKIKHNNRAYVSQGFEFMLDWDFKSENVSHDLEIGIRFHQDEEDRFQAEDTYLQSINGGLALTELGIFGSSSSNNRLTEADAMSFYIRDEIKYGDWTLSPGVRYENVDVRRREWSTPERIDASSSKDQTNTQSAIIPGLGITYQVNDNLILIGGVHKGFAPAGYKPETDNEESLSYEFGGRAFIGDFYAEAIFFINDYDNIIGECTTVSGADCSESELGEQFNSGTVTVNGLELVLAYDFSTETDYKLPLSFNYTYMDGEFDSTFDNSFFGDVQKGDPLTYFPEQQGQLSFGIEHSNGWSIKAAASYVDAVCTEVTCERILSDFDTTNTIFNLDIVADYELSDKVTVYLKVENASDEADVVGRHPSGVMVQKDRSFYLGLRVEI